MKKLLRYNVIPLKKWWVLAWTVKPDRQEDQQIVCLHACVRVCMRACLHSRVYCSVGLATAFAPTQYVVSAQEPYTIGLPLGQGQMRTHRTQ